MSQRSKQLLRAIAIPACTCTMLWIGSSSYADEKVKTAVSEQTKAEQAGAASQKKIEQLDDENSKMLVEYRSAIQEAESLKKYNDELAVQVKSQQEQLGTMNQQLEQIATTSRDVLPMMDKMLQTLDEFVKLDLPFLPEERAGRIASLKDMMGRADVSTSEKYRRLVEAYQIELEYGRTIESYQGKVNDKTVDFLRAGRVTIMYQSLDGKETGYWDADAKKWAADDSYTDAVKSGIKIAKKQSAADFLSVAIHAPKEAT